MPEHPLVRDLRKQLDGCRGRWGVISESAGVSHSWISQFVRGDIDNPTIGTLQRVGKAIELLPRKAA